MKLKKYSINVLHPRIGQLKYMIKRISSRAKIQKNPSKPTTPQLCLYLLNNGAHIDVFMTNKVGLLEFMYPQMDIYTAFLLRYKAYATV